MKLVERAAHSIWAKPFAEILPRMCSLFQIAHLFYFVDWDKTHKLTIATAVKYFSSATSTAIIRVSRNHYRLVWAALTFINHFPKPVNAPCVIQVIRVSGTIRKAEEEAIRRARDNVQRARRVSDGKHTQSIIPEDTENGDKSHDGYEDITLLNGAAIDEEDTGTLVERDIESDVSSYDVDG